MHIWRTQFFYIDLGITLLLIQPLLSNRGDKIDVNTVVTMLSQARDSGIQLSGRSLDLLAMEVSTIVGDRR